MREAPFERCAELLLWLRDTQRAPAAARLVLCDRAIETVSGWAGVAMPDRFIGEHLVPAWAHGTIRHAVGSAIRSVMWADRRRLAPQGTPERTEWERIVTEPELGIRQSSDGFTADLGGVVRRLDWLSQRVEPHQMRRRLLELAERLESPKTTLRWLKELEDEAAIHERRRARSRNALVHGGPLHEPTVAHVLAFVEYMANEAVAQSVQGLLRGQSVMDHFLDVQLQLAEVRRRLEAGTPPDEALFWTLD